jgi:RimJ/RimL family protein N-acetyltransferase
MSEAVSPLLVDIPAELIGERVMLRQFRPGDGAQFWEAVDESRQHLLPWMPYTHKSPMDSEVSVRKMHADWFLRVDLMFGIWELSTGRYLGLTGLIRIHWEVPSFEISYWLRKSAVGHGYMTEAVGLLTSMAFETLNANRVHITAASGNHKSAAIPQRLGFVLEATQRNVGRRSTGELVDMLVFAMTPKEYEEAKSSGLMAKTPTEFSRRSTSFSGS